LYSGNKFNVKIDQALFAPVQVSKENSPSFGLVLGILVMPVVLISFNTVLNTLIKMDLANSQNAIVQIFIVLGQTPIALLITLLFSLMVFSRQFSAADLANALSDTGMPIIVAAFVISTCLRVAQGSATVALTTTAALMSPVVALATDLSSIDLCLIVISIAGGATVLSHFNDSGFWLVSRLLNMDEKTTLKTWTVMETLLGTIAFAIAATLSIFL
jgi:GntP family gluconate:H+ symporter